MRRKKLTADEVSQWIAVNARRVKALRLLTDADIARRIGRLPLLRGRSLNFYRPLVTRILGGKFRGMRASEWLLDSLQMLVGLCNALEMTPAELLSRPDDMSLLQQDGHKTAREIRRKKQQLKQTQEQQEMQALLESLGLDE